MSSNLITELWLREVGFKPHFFGSEPNRHWQLWLGEDLAIDVSFGREKPHPWWFCWLRTSGEHTPERSINLRDLTYKHEIITLVQSLTFRAPWVRTFPATHIHRLRLINDRPCWTVVIVLKPVREWGFWHVGEWIPWEKYVKGRIAGQMKNCD